MNSSPEDMMNSSILSEYEKIPNDLVTRELEKDDNVVLVYKDHKFRFEEVIKNEKDEEVVIYSCIHEECDIFIREEIVRKEEEDEERIIYMISNERHSHPPPSKEEKKHSPKRPLKFPVLEKVNPKTLYIGKEDENGGEVLNIFLKIPPEYKSPIIISKLVLRDNKMNEFLPNILPSTRTCHERMIIPFYLSDDGKKRLKESVDIELHFFSNFQNEAELILEKYESFKILQSNQQQKEEEEEEGEEEEELYHSPKTQIQKICPSSVENDHKIDIYFTISTVEYFSMFLSPHKSRIEYISFDGEEKSKSWTFDELVTNISDNNNNNNNSFEFCLKNISIPSPTTNKKVDIRLKVNTLRTELLFKNYEIPGDFSNSKNKKKKEEELTDNIFIAVTTEENEVDCFGNTVLNYCIAQKELDLLKFFIDIKHYKTYQPQQIMNTARFFQEEVRIFEYLAEKRRKMKDENLTTMLRKSLVSQKMETRRLQLEVRSFRSSEKSLRKKMDELILQNMNYEKVIEKMIKKEREKGSYYDENNNENISEEENKFLQSGLVYYIINKWSGKCLDNRGQSKVGGGHHSWEFKRNNKNQGFRMIQNKKKKKKSNNNNNNSLYFNWYILNNSSGKSLDNGGSTKNGTTFKSGDVSQNNPNQMFSIIPAEQINNSSQEESSDRIGFFYIQCKSSGKYMELANGKTRNGSKIHQWDLNKNSPFQLWRFEKWP